MAIKSDRAVSRIAFIVFGGMEWKGISESYRQTKLDAYEFERIFDRNCNIKEKVASNAEEFLKMRDELRKRNIRQVKRSTSMREGRVWTADEEFLQFNKNRKTSTNLTQEGIDKNIDRLDNIQKSLDRIKKTQDVVKAELNLAKGKLGQKRENIEESYGTITNDIQEIGHLIELARFVNKKMERIDVKERLEREMGKK